VDARFLVARWGHPPGNPIAVLNDTRLPAGGIAFGSNSRRCAYREPDLLSAIDKIGEG
jgi:hypothetical protein